MEKKSLGRGLEDISNVFFSSSEERILPQGFSSVKIRDEICSSCANFLKEPFEQPSCTFFTFGNDGQRDPHRAPPSLTHASYCKLFTPKLPEKALSLLEKEDEDSPPADPECEIEEVVTVRKRITYPPAPGSQEKIKQTLFEHLRDGFSIKNVEIIKVQEKSGAHSTSRREEICMIITDLPPR